jgi:hypothetical protein
MKTNQIPEGAQFLQALIALRRTLEEREQHQGDPFLAMLVDAVEPPPAGEPPTPRRKK